MSRSVVISGEEAEFQGDEEIGERPESFVAGRKAEMKDIDEKGNLR